MSKPHAVTVSEILSGATQAEQFAILAAIGVGGYILYQLYETIKNGPSQLGQWLQQQAQSAENAASNAVDSITSSPVIDPSSGVSLFNWLP